MYVSGGLRVAVSTSVLVLMVPSSGKPVLGGKVRMHTREGKVSTGTLICNYAYSVEDGPS